MKNITVFILVLIISGCVSNKKEDVPVDITIKYKEDNFLLSSNYLPGMTILGDVSGDYLYITQVVLFSNWEQGWTEGHYEASGKYRIVVNNGNTSLIEEDRLQLWDIKNAEVRYQNKYYREDDGLQKARNRIHRINEYISVLKDRDNHIQYIGGRIEKKSLNLVSLRENFYPKLFPEVVGFKELESSNRLPKEYYSSNFERVKVQGSNISWYQDYTKSVFPENLWELRDSGTIFRDFQEAPDIFISLYNLNMLLDEIEDIKCH